MGKEAELFKAAKSGNVTYLRRVFAPYLKKGSTASLGGIRKSATPNVQDDNGYTLLHHATLNGQGEVVSLLLTCGASALIPDCSGSYPLHLAAWKGDLEIVKLLVMQGPSYADVNQQSDSDDTPLHLAATYGYSDVVEFLLQRHADAVIRNAKHETPLDLAAQYGHLDTVHLLISSCPELLVVGRHEAPTTSSPLHLAVRNGHTLVALSIINAGLSINTLSDRGTALHEAALSGKMDTVKLLLDKGIDIGMRDGKGRTVLEALDEIPGEKLKDIQKLIAEYRDGIRHSCVENKIIAVARKNYTSVTKQPGLLAFKKGDCIVVEKKDRGDTFVGSVNGRTGSFFANDVEFYSVSNGNVEKTEDPLSTPSSAYLLVPPPQSRQQVPQPVVSPRGSAEGATMADQSYQQQVPVHNPQRGAAAMAMPLAGDAAPPSAVPMTFGTDVASQSPDMGSRVAVSVPKQNIASILIQRPVPGYDMVPIRDPSCQPFPPQDQTPSSPDPTSSVDPIPVPLPPDPNPEARLKTRMSKKEKKLALRNDKGGYAELYPINPQEIKEPSSHYEMAPVGVATPPNGDEQPIKASYCMLDVKNFDDMPQSPDSVPTLHPPRLARYEDIPMGKAQLHLSEEEGLATVVMAGVGGGGGGGGGGEMTQGDIQKGYCVLEVRNFDEQGVSREEPGRREVRTMGAHSGLYQNVELPTTSSTTSTRRGNDYVNVALEGTLDHRVSHELSSEGTLDPQNDHRLSSRYEFAGGGGGRGGASATPGRAPREMVYEVVELGKRGGGGTERGGGVDRGAAANEGEVAGDLEGGVSDDDRGVFAGLVLSASKQMEEEGERSGGGVSITSWNQEWNKIETLLSDVRSGAPPLSSPVLPSAAQPGAQTQIAQWLSRIQMDMYTIQMVMSGFDQLQFLNGVIVTQEDLADIGIVIPDHQLTIMAAISLLPGPPSLQHVATMEQFLEMLHLSHLEPKFIGYSLEKISKLLDLELSSVVGVEEIGYRRRLEYGIRELKAHHPDWNQKKIVRAVSVTLPNTTFLQPTAGTMLRTPGDSSPASSGPHRKPKKSTRHEVLSILRTSPTHTAGTEETDGSMQTGKDRALVLRPPSQAIVPPATLPDRDMWKHPNKTLIQDCVNYDAKYLGSVIMVTMRGTQSLEEACLRLKTSTETMQKIPDITLSISWKGVKFVDSHTKVVVSTHAIRDISYCSKDIEDKRVFGYVTKDRSGNYCHVFMTSTPEVSDEIVMTIGQAAEITYQKVMCSRKFPHDLMNVDSPSS